MAKLLKLRRGTTSQHSSFTGAEGEVTVDTTKDTLVVHDGSTAGGVPLAKESAALSLIDEDNMSTDSATRPPSQQSVKAYVDAKVPTTITVADESTDTSCNVLFTTAATGDLPPKSGTNLTFNSNTGILTATGFAGDITGNVTGNTSGSSGSCSGNAATATTSTNVTVADESSDTSCNVLFTTAATGDLPPKSGTNLTFNSNTGILTATGFAGALTGNVTGNASGTAATVTGAAQTAITSVGTLSGLTVSGDSSFTGQSDFTGHLKEAVTITAGKLSDNLNLDIENGNVFLFTTAESATALPNIRYNGSTTLDSKMSVGDCLSVTIITTANASAFSAQLTIDGNAVTENWTGGSAPSGGGSSGVDIHAYTIIKTASNTYTVIANHTKTS